MERQIPQFIHPEVEVFYHYDLAIPRSEVEPLFLLPRETLIEDLRKMLRDAITHFDYFREEEKEGEYMDFVIHALWMLADLKAENALPDALDILRQEHDFLEFWLSDFMTEDYWEVLYHLGGQSLEQLKTFSLEPGLYPFARTSASSAVEQIALHHPERRSEVIDWYRSLFEHFLAVDREDPSVDLDFISSIVSDTISFQAKELLPLIKQLFDKRLVYDDYSGPYETVVEEMESKPDDWDKRPVFSSIFDRYHDAVTKWHYYRMKFDEAYREANTYKPRPTNYTLPKPPDPLKGELFHASSEGTYHRPGKKIGRNDPCPCGSGKKYKKCCGKNG